MLQVVNRAGQQQHAQLISSRKRGKTAGRQLRRLLHQQSGFFVRLGKGCGVIPSQQQILNIALNGFIYKNLVDLEILIPPRKPIF